MKSWSLFFRLVLWMLFLFGNGATTDAQTHILDSLEQELSHTQLSDSSRLRLLLSICNYVSERNPAKAEEYARSAIYLAKKLNKNLELAQAYRFAGTSYLGRAQYGQALALYDSSLHIAERIGDREALSSVWTNIGLVYAAQSDYTRALEYALRSMRIDEELGQNNNLAISLVNIGTLYYRQKEYATALDYHGRAKKLFHDLGDTAAIGEVCYRIGQVYKDQQSFTKALFYFDTALVVMRRYENFRLIGEITHDIGTTYLFLGNVQQGNRYLQEALRVRRARQDGAGIAQTLSAFGSLSLLTNDMTNAERYYLESLHIANDLDLKELQMQGSFHLGELYKQQGQYQKALEYKERGYIYKDSLFNTDRSREIGRLEMRQELEKKESENQILLHSRELQEANQSRQRIFLIAVSVGLLLFVGIAALLWRFNRQQRLTNIQLREQQNILQEQAQEIEMINGQLQQRNLLLTDANMQINAQADILQTKNTTLEQLGAEKNEFLGIVAHDLKNPLTSIMLSADMAIAYRAKMPETERIDLFQKIYHSAERMYSIVTNLLDINAIETGNMKFFYTNVAIAPLVQEIVDDYQPQARLKNITLHYLPSRPNADIEETIYTDKNILREIIVNLLSNAVKYSPHGKNVFVRITNTEHAVRVEVQDEGEGISADDMTKLFGKFARLSARPTGGEHSTGLGLSIVKKMVEGMNGRVWCESELGEGARFIVELPAAASIIVAKELPRRIEE
jgi:signal transduction histidine kinase